MVYVRVFSHSVSFLGLFSAIIGDGLRRHAKKPAYIIELYVLGFWPINKILMKLNLEGEKRQIPMHTSKPRMHNCTTMLNAILCLTND